MSFLFLCFVLVLDRIVDCFKLQSSSARNQKRTSRGAFKSGLASGDSGLQLDLEIALSGVSAKIQPLRLFSRAEDALKRRVT